MLSKIIDDYLIIEPKDIDLSQSPLRKGIDDETYVLGAFNPGMAILPNGNLLLMVRIAETLKESIKGELFYYIRWDDENGFLKESLPLNYLDMTDPRKYIVKSNLNTTYCLTSFSWLLPVEIDLHTKEVVKQHYDKAVIPQGKSHEYGIEDARITQIGANYYMTACAVSSNRHSTILYQFDENLNYEYLGIIQDHQNKDMVIFPEMIKGYYYALTRPIGEHYFYSSGNFSGPNIMMSKSPDLLHWKPVENFNFTIDQKLQSIMKLGGGSPPVKINDNWILLFHIAENKNNVGHYKTYYAVLDGYDPTIVKEMNLTEPFLSANNELTNHLKDMRYIDDVVFTSGIVVDNGHYYIGSGELDLCCRITKMKISI